MRALSLWEPWASLIAHGIKMVETRPRSTAGAYRGPVAIQASKHWSTDEVAAWFRFAETFRGQFPAYALSVEGFPPVPRTLGKVVAVAQLVDVWQFAGDELVLGKITRDEVLCGDTAPGRWGLRLTDVQRLEVPVPLKGKQGLWNLSPDEERAVLAAVRS